MKKTFYNTIIAFLFVSVAIANPIVGKYKYKEEKKISKSFAVNSDALVDIQNKYGSIFITTWEGKNVSIDVLITVSSNSEKWVKNRINEIDVSFTNSVSNIKAVTEIESSNSWISSQNNSIEIKYTVKIPKSSSVNLSQKYGEITAHALYANTDIYCQYGKINLESLYGISNNIKIDYCSGSNIDFMKKGNIKAKYSKLTVGKFEQINLNADYTDVDFGEGMNIELDLDYGKLSFIKIGSLKGSGAYMGLKISELNGNLEFNTKYSQLAINKIDLQVKNVKINASYTNVKLFYPINYAFDVDVDIQFGDFNYESALDMNVSNDKQFDKHYNGFYLKRNVNNIEISNKYGNVSLKSL